MTQTNNEREAVKSMSDKDNSTDNTIANELQRLENIEREKLDARYFNEKLRLVLEGLPNYTRSELARELQRLSNTASPISQNEQQEAIGKYNTSDIELGAEFIISPAKVSAIFKKYGAGVELNLYLSPHKQAIPEGSAWLIEKYINGKLHYAYCDEIGILDWTSDNLLAMRFSRKQDATQLTSIMEDADRVSEHMWAAPTNTEVGE